MYQLQLVSTLESYITVCLVLGGCFLLLLFFSSLSRSKYYFIFSLFFYIHYYFVLCWNNQINKMISSIFSFLFISFYFILFIYLFFCFFFFLFFFLLMSTRSGFMAGIRGSVYITKSLKILYVSLSLSLSPGHILVCANIIWCININLFWWFCKFIASCILPKLSGIAIMNSSSESKIVWKLPLWIFTSAGVCPLAFNSILQFSMNSWWNLWFCWIFCTFSDTLLSKFARPNHQHFL